MQTGNLYHPGGQGTANHFFSLMLDHGSQVITKGAFGVDLGGTVGRIQADRGDPFAVLQVTVLDTKAKAQNFAIECLKDLELVVINATAHHVTNAKRRTKRHLAFCDYQRQRHHHCDSHN